MTPLHLEILLHYYTSQGIDFNMIRENKTRYDYAIDLMEKGFLFLPIDDKYNFRITVAGKKIVKFLLKTIDIQELP